MLRTTAAGSALFGVTVWCTISFSTTESYSVPGLRSASFAPHCARVTIGGGGQRGWSTAAASRAPPRSYARGWPSRWICDATAAAAPAPSPSFSASRRVMPAAQSGHVCCCESVTIVPRVAASTIPSAARESRSRRCATKRRVSPADTVRVAVDVTPLIGVRTGVGAALAEIIDAFGQLDDRPAIVPYALSLRARQHRGELPRDSRFVPVPAVALLRAWTRAD